MDFNSKCKSDLESGFNFKASWWKYQNLSSNFNFNLKFDF